MVVVEDTVPVAIDDEAEVVETISVPTNEVVVVVLAVPVMTVESEEYVVDPPVNVCAVDWVMLEFITVVEPTDVVTLDVTVCDLVIVRETEALTDSDQRASPSTSSPDDDPLPR